MTRTPIPITSRHRLKLLAALRRVNRQLSAWDELDALALMPPALRPRLLATAGARGAVPALLLQGLPRAGSEGDGDVRALRARLRGLAR